MAIEDFARDVRNTGSSDRSFGLVMAGFFGLIGFWPLLHRSDLRIWAIAVALGFLIAAIVCPGMLARANQLWMRFGALLHVIVSPVALAVVFYLTVVPIGLLMRLSGKDPLRLKPDPAARSYWIPRQPPGPDPKSLTNQF